MLRPPTIPLRQNIVPCTRLIKDVKQDNILDKHPAEIVDIALDTLQSLGIQLVEWRSLLYRRLGVPVLVLDYSFLVPDDDLDRASDLLTRTGLPLSPPNKLFMKTYGDFYAKGRFHRITKATRISSVQHITLYPMSFSTLAPADLIEQSPIHIQPSRCSKILVPRPPALFASFVRMMTMYPRFGGTRTTLESELSELVGYHLYGLSGGFVDADDEGAWEEMDVDRRVSEAGQLVRQWSVEEEWRAGEEWIADALAAIAFGADVGELPYKT
ncbi:hypothetical protein JR316_0013331 [Psilocybe cubensis]|uniref:Uncharacterized protein n=2 Tax=Psilocybe cubensis TaxID=181762 RepID=A0A8H7XQK9_PSICU|nr:hypothetical protein JR316_0013331 [Psilocybe cubensis]KAH9474863.1 hypothetical protein JR316_0013331 [Psilocybe cubensis]